MESGKKRPNISARKSILILLFCILTIISIISNPSPKAIYTYVHGPANVEIYNDKMEISSETLSQSESVLEGDGYKFNIEYQVKSYTNLYILSIYSIRIKRYIDKCDEDHRTYENNHYFLGVFGVVFKLF